MYPVDGVQPPKNVTINAHAWHPKDARLRRLLRGIRERRFDGLILRAFGVSVQAELFSFCGYFGRPSIVLQA